MSFKQSFISPNGGEIAFLQDKSPPNRLESNPVHRWVAFFLTGEKKTW